MSYGASPRLNRPIVGPGADRFTPSVERASNEDRAPPQTLESHTEAKGTAVLFVNTPSDRLRCNLDIPLFADCTARELRRIDALATALSVDAGRVLCRQGDIGRECFELLDGHVDVDTDGHHFTLGRGALLGEIALLIADGRRTATVTALSDITVLVFTRTEFTQLMTGISTVAHKVLQESTRRLIANSDAR
jgi:CRP/FNR family cyclic AMP-dependent transcriptional regulator